jgi:hypothetical protein
MKKFYIPIFTMFFLIASFSMQGQIYNSILTNPSNFTLDDFHFWQGGVAPPNPCIGCNITVNTSVTVPHQGGSSLPIDNVGTELNHITLNGSTLRLQGAGTVLTINTYLSLTNTTQIFVATAPSYNVSIILNDQVDMDANSLIQVGNNNSYIDASNLANNPIQGTIPDFANGGVPDAGIYSLIPRDGQPYTLVLNGNGNGTPLHNFAFYNFNCPGAAPAGCTFGIINGPAITGPTPGAPPATNFGIIFSSSTTLPVELVQFLATKNDDGSVKISWATSQEENSNYYDVERSSDQSQWSSIGTVKAKGYSSITTNYFLTDKSPVNGTGYYRLKMVDLDGKFIYSKAISVTTDNSSLPLVIYSNPFSDQIRLKINVSRPQNLILTVTDMLGKTYISQSYQAQNGDNFVNLQPSIGSSGMYILRIQGNSYDQTVKLEKQ